MHRTAWHTWVPPLITRLLLPLARPLTPVLVPHLRVAPGRAGRKVEQRRDLREEVSLIDLMPTTAGVRVKVSLESGVPGAVEMFDVSGRLVQKTPWAVSTGRVRFMRLDLSGLSAGIYFARARRGSGEQVGMARKVVIVR